MHEADMLWEMRTALSATEVLTAFRTSAERQRVGLTRGWRRDDASDWTGERPAAAWRRHGVVIEHPRFPVLVCVARADGDDTIARLQVMNGEVGRGERGHVVRLMEATASAIRAGDRGCRVTKRPPDR